MPAIGARQDRHRPGQPARRRSLARSRHRPRRAGARTRAPRRAASLPRAIASTRAGGRGRARRPARRASFAPRARGRASSRSGTRSPCRSPSRSTFSAALMPLPDAQAERGELDRIAGAPVAQQDPGLRTRERDQLLARGPASPGARRERARGPAAETRTRATRARRAATRWRGRSARRARRSTPAPTSPRRGTRGIAASSTRPSAGAPLGGGLQLLESVLGDRGARSREAEIAIVRGGCVGAVQRDPARQREQRQREQGCRTRSRAGGSPRLGIGGTDPRPYSGALTSAAPRVDSTRVDIAARFREYVRLDKPAARGRPDPRRAAPLAQALKRFLSIHFAPDRPAKVADQRAIGARADPHQGELRHRSRAGGLPDDEPLARRRIRADRPPARAQGAVSR